MDSLPFYQTCFSDDDPQNYGNDLLHIEHVSLSSQPSLLLLPSLTRQPTYVSINQHHCITTLKGHSSYISSLVLTRKFLYTGSSDEEIRSWKFDPVNSPTSNIVAIGNGAVKSLVVLSGKLFSAHQDHKIRVWKIGNHESNYHPKYTRVATLPTFGDRVLKFLVPKNHVRIRRHKKNTWVHHVDTVSALALSKDGALLYSVSWDRTIKIWRTSNFRCLESVPNAHDDAINAVISSPDGSIFTGSADKKIKVWIKTPGEKRHNLVDTLIQHKSGINALALSTNGLFLYSGACDRSIVVWEKTDDSGKMVVVGALRGHTKSILCLTVISDLVCSGSADKTVRIWRCFNRSFSCLSVLEGHKGPVKCLAATVKQTTPSDSSSSYLVYSGSLDCDIKVWQVFGHD